MLVLIYLPCLGCYSVTVKIISVHTSTSELGVRGCRGVVREEKTVLLFGDAVIYLILADEYSFFKVIMQRVTSVRIAPLSLLSESGKTAFTLKPNFLHVLLSDITGIGLDKEPR